jgi:transglutaminase-like putative cysteine protease
MVARYLITGFITFLFFTNVFAGAPDSSVSIANAKDEIQYSWNIKLNRVEINRKSTIDYISNAYQVNYPVAEFYNDHITINSVTCKVDGRTPRDFKPHYSYYGEENVFYSDARVCYFSMPLTKTGSTGSVTFDETYDDPRYFTAIHFTGNAAIKHKEVTVKIPRWMKAELRELNFGTYDIKKTVQYNSADDADVITYTMNNIPAFVKESNSPGPSYIYPHLLVLNKSATAGGQSFPYFNTLADQYAWYRGLTKDLTNDATVITKAKELTTGITGDMDKVKAVFYYVQDNIRYIAFEDGMAGFKPEKADEVLRKKYGDCKGMANLTKSMLVALGFDARLCWLGTNHIAYDYQTPSMAVDNHMICALLYKGITYYLDATETYLGINEYAERIQGRQVLIEDGSKYLLSKVPYAAPTQNNDQESCKLSISGNSMVGKVNRRWKGENKEEMLSGLNSVKQENADETIKKYLSVSDNAYTINDLVLSSTNDPDKDLTASYTVDRKNGISVFSKDYYIDLDNRKEYAQSAIKIEERKHDLWFSNKENINIEMELEIPANYKATSIPPDLNIVKPGYEFHISYVSLPNKLIYKKTLSIKNTILPKAKFAQWNQDIELLNKSYNENVIIKPISQ